MNLVNIIGKASVFDEVSKKCIIGSNFQPEITSNITTDKPFFSSFNDDNPFSSTLRQLIDFAGRAKISLNYNDFFNINDSVEDISQLISSYSNNYDIILGKINNLEKSITEDEQILIELDYLKDITVDLSELFNLKFISFRFGRLSSDNYNKWKTYVDTENVFFIPTYIEKEYVWGMYFTPKVLKAQSDNLFASLGFERIKISLRAKGTPINAYNDIAKEIDIKKENLKELKSELNTLILNINSKILPIYSKIRYLNDTFELRKYSSRTKNSFYLTGWVPKDEVNEFVERFKIIKSVCCVVEEPKEVSIIPPTKLKNIAIFKPFEEFVKLYGLPSYTEFDPSPLMAIIYSLLFGIMFGDVGQGAVLLIAGLVLWFTKKNMFGRIITTVGCSSIIFGFVYGSVFGFENIFYGFIKPIEQTIYVLLFAISLGTILITIGIFINIFNGIKQKDLEKSVFSHNGLVGLIFYWSILIAAINSVAFGKNIVNLWYVVFLLILPVILIFFKEPLAHIFQKKGKFTFHNGIMDFVIVNLFELFDVLLSFITNTISFVRVGAFAISHAAMMMVVFILAKGSSNTENIYLIIFGNAFVILLEAMLVGIQVLRLHFFEIFSRFFSGEGKDYEPIKVNYDNH